MLAGSAEAYTQVVGPKWMRAYQADSDLLALSFMVRQGRRGRRWSEIGRFLRNVANASFRPALSKLLASAHLEHVSRDVAIIADAV